MSISTASVLVNGTVATTGGTATTFISKGQNLDVHNTILDEGNEFIAQSTVSFNIKSPKVSTGAPNGFTQARNTVRISSPLALDNGSYTTNVLSISLAVDPETTDAEIETMLVLAAQILADSDYSDFWKKQSLA